MSAVPQLDLNRTIRRWDRRRRLLESIIWTPRGLLAGVLIGLLVAIISHWRAWLLQEEIIRVALGASLLSLGLVLAVIWLWPRPILWLARHFDLRFGLKERVSTAYELSHGEIPPADDLAPYQFEDTRLTIENLNLRDVLPLKPRRVEWAALLAASALLLALLMMDNPFTSSILAERELDQSIEDEITALENTREDILGNQDLTDAERQELLEPLDQALETLREPDISREEAVAALSEAQQELEERQNGLNAEQEAAFEDASEALSGSELTEDVSDALSEGDLEQAAQEFEDLSESIDQAELTPEDLQALSEQLSQAAEDMQQTNPEASQALQDAAEALQQQSQQSQQGQQNQQDQQGQQQSAQESLQQAAEALQQQGEQAQQSPQAQAAQQAGEQLSESRQQVAQAGQQSGDPQDGEQSAFVQSDQESSEGEQSDTAVVVPGDQNEGDQGAVVPGQGQSQSNQQAQIGQTSANEGDSATTSIGQSSNQPGQAGAGNAPGDEGRDTQQGEQSNSQVDIQNAPGINEGLGNFDAVFAPQRIGDTGTQDLMGLNGETTGDEILDQRESGFNENFDADSTVPYDRVFADYANSVNDNLEADYIPIGLRDVIRNYFASLEP